MMRSIQWHPCPSVPHKPITCHQHATKSRRGRKIMHTPPHPPSPPQGFGTTPSVTGEVLRYMHLPPV
eukprot:1188373-Prymnesium_polylepis.1